MADLQGSSWRRTACAGLLPVSRITLGGRDLGRGYPAHAGIWGLPEFAGGGAPAFVWPPDHTWCVAADIDPHWAATGASAPLIERLTGDPGLDAVEANPADEPPAYR
jgi:hypothetical protein